VGAEGLPQALYDLLRRWDAEGLWPHARWCDAQAFSTTLPRWDLFGPVPMHLFALGLSSRHGFVAPRLSQPLAVPAADAPWRVSWLATPHASDEGLPTHWMDPSSDTDALTASCSPGLDAVALVNVGWPHVSLASSWIATLQRWPLVVDPDPERVALLRLFAVRARWAPYPALPISVDLQADLACAESRLGLADPRWLMPHPSAPLSLAVLGSSSAQTERRWAEIARHQRRAHILLLPRINALCIDSLEEAKALQGWLQVLSSCADTILQLEEILEGICSLPQEPARILGRGAENCSLAYWEKCR